MVISDDTELIRLRREIAELRASLEARTQANGLLLQMVTDVISTLKLEQVLHHIVEHLVATLGCHAAFVYLWDAESDRLVLRGASEPYRHFIGRIQLGRGEGLVGWSALTGKPAMLRERALEDPRFRYFPELEEERFQAILTVPMTGADGRVVSVISLHTIAPQEFTEEQVRLVGAMAPILGGAIETSELYENTTRKLAVLSTLSGLVQTVRSGRYLDDALRVLNETTVRVTASGLCVLVLAEPGQDTLAVRAYLPADDDAATLHAATLPRRPWEQLAEMAAPEQLGLGGAALSALGELASGGAHLAAPLVAAGEQLGLMVCYRAAERPYGDDDAALLNIIANQAAIAIKNSQLADLLAERDVPARLFRDLMQGPEDGEEMVWRRAAVLGCDLSQLHAPVILDLPGDAARGEKRRAAAHALAHLLRRWLAEAYPGSLVHVDTSLYLLVRLPETGDAAALPVALEALQPAIERELGLRLQGGVGRACRALAEYRRGFNEAREALRVGRTVRPGGGVTYFDALGAARYLSRIPADGVADELPDRYQESVARVAAYDARKGTTLLETLEVYLSCGGNIARAAERLFVHRNTLVQRLEKLHELLRMDPHDSDHWLALHIAVRLWQMRGR